MQLTKLLETVLENFWVKWYILLKISVRNIFAYYCISLFGIKKFMNVHTACDAFLPHDVTDVLVREDVILLCFCRVCLWCSVVLVKDLSAFRKKKILAGWSLRRSLRADISEDPFWLILAGILGGSSQAYPRRILSSWSSKDPLKLILQRSSHADPPRILSSWSSKDPLKLTLSGSSQGPSPVSFDVHLRLQYTVVRIFTKMTTSTNMIDS